MNGKKRRTVLMAVILIGLCALLVGLQKSGVLAHVHSAEELREVIGRTGHWAGAVYFFLQMSTVIIAPIPSNVMMLAGALALGFARAAVIGLCAVVSGSMLVFLAARALGQGAVQRWLDRGVMEKYLPIIEEKQAMFLFLAMLFPFFPDDAICILAGLTSIKTSRFFTIMLLGRPWGLLFAALVGSGAITLPLWGWAVLAAGMLVLFAAAMRYSARIEAAVLALSDKLTRGMRCGKKREESK